MNDKIEFFFSTINYRILKNTQSPFKKVKKATIINQINESSDNSVKLANCINFHEMGLSKSRNRALKLMTAEFAMLCDDDVDIVENAEDNIVKAFEKYPEADVITFRIRTPAGGPFRNYHSDSFKLKWLDVFSVVSMEIVLKKSSIEKANINFDERFGLGGRFPSSEENIFLMDCLKKGLTIRFVPIDICIHSEESSGFRKMDKNYFKIRGAVLKRVFRTLYPMIFPFWLVWFYMKANNEIGFLQALTSMFVGVRQLDLSGD